MCQNSMVILKLLSEEVFDFSSGRMTSRKAKQLKYEMCQQFSKVFSLCTFDLENATSSPLISATLETLLRFLSWIPFGYIFERDLLQSLISKFFAMPEYRNISLQCLTGVVSMLAKDFPATYHQKLICLFAENVTQLKILLLASTSLVDAYDEGGAKVQEFVQCLSLLLTGFMKEHSRLLKENSQLQPYLLETL